MELGLLSTYIDNVLRMLLSHRMATDGEALVSTPCRSNVGDITRAIASTGVVAEYWGLHDERHGGTGKWVQPHTACTSKY